LCAAALGVPLPVLAGALATVAIGRRGLTRRGARRAASLRHRAVVEFAFALAAELRAGLPPPRALAAASVASGPLSAHLADAVSAVGNGADPAAELDLAAVVPGCRRLSAIAAAWRATHQVGAAVADVLDRLGESFDADDAAAEELSAAMAGPRATMLMLALLPAVGVALGESIGAHPLHLLVHRPIGWMLLAAAAVLDGAGLAWTRRLLRLPVSA
jgi:tight adherence protein B